MTFFHKPRLPVSIPSVENNSASMLAAINALKQAVEFMQGAISDNNAAVRVFIQNKPPTAHSVGDLWITTLPTSSINYWTGEQWQLFAIAHADGTLHST